MSIPMKCTACTMPMKYSRLLTDHWHRAFSKIDHSGSTAKIVSKQNTFSKKVTLIGIEPSTLGLSYFFFYSSMPSQLWQFLLLIKLRL